jgi:hypothetical protein
VSLPWVRLDTAIADHPKMLALMDAKKHRAALAYINEKLPTQPEQPQPTGDMEKGGGE